MTKQMLTGGIQRSSWAPPPPPPALGDSNMLPLQNGSEEQSNFPGPGCRRKRALYWRLKINKYIHIPGSVGSQGESVKQIQM